MKPAVTLLEMLHCSVEFIEILISQQMVVQYVPLSSGIVERAIVSGTGKVEPFLNQSTPRKSITGWPKINRVTG